MAVPLSASAPERRRLRIGPVRVPLPRSLTTKLALVFLAITALAFSVVFFVTVPALDSNLTDQRLSDLERVALATSRPFESAVSRDVPAPDVDRLVRNVADESDSVVALLGAQRSGAGEDASVRPYVISDSRASTVIDEPLEIAREVFASGRPSSRTATVLGDRVARVARPVVLGGEVQWVLVWTRGLSEVEESVGIIRRQVLLAGAAALLVAFIGGWLVARGVARRVRRLDAAADEVAGGVFPGPLPIDSDDELGQLTRTFNEMQTQLSRVDRARKEFIATASHELRTPIFSLGGFVELLRDEEIDPATRDEFLSTMAEQVERLKRLSVDLLDLSRLDAGTLELRRERTDIAELVRTVAAEFHPRVKDRRGQLELAADRERVHGMCDPERARQIVRILLDNALSHTPEETPVTIAVRDRGEVVEILVADRGPGLEGDALERIFDRFYTADAARGAGLGLAIARELAELMDGHIRVTSRAGETIFTVELPAAA